MANAYVREYAAVGFGAPGQAMQAPHEPALASQTVSFTTSAQSAAFNANTRLIWVRADAAANIEVGDNPTATATDYPQILADTDYFFSVDGGGKIAFYDGTS